MTADARAQFEQALNAYLDAIESARDDSNEYERVKTLRAALIAMATRPAAIADAVILIARLREAKTWCAQDRQLTQLLGDTIEHLNGPRKFQHYKGGAYELLIDGAEMKADRTAVVVYRSVQSGRTWVRPAAEFAAKFVEVA